MRDFESIGEFVRFLQTRRAAVRVEQRHGMEVGGEMLARSAKEMIGHEDLWQPLAESTVEEKQRLGYTGQVSDTDPLLRTGQLRDSISAKVSEAEIELGSTDEVGKFHEFGTDHVPARPFVGSTMFREGQEAARMVFRHVIAALTGSPRPHEPGQETNGE